MENKVLVETSARHVHVTKEDLETLFGPGYELTRKKDLSQPGQYACEERVDVVGSKKTLSGVSILGPVRSASQVELSLTDCVTLGLKAPVRLSGKVENTPGIVLVNGTREVFLPSGVIVAQRHIHITPEDAAARGVKDRDVVRLRVFTARPLVFEDVVVRVSPDFRTYAHLDYDEANACGFVKGDLGMLVP